MNFESRTSGVAGARTSPDQAGSGASRGGMPRFLLPLRTASLPGGLSARS